MAHHELLGRQIRFEQKWFVDSSLSVDLVRETWKISRKLPSTSQLHRFKKVVVAANDLKSIKDFLEERQEKAATRSKWCFRFRDAKPFNSYLADVFLSRVENASALDDITGYKYFGLIKSSLPDLFQTDFNKYKYLIAKKALLDFIDELILLKEGFLVTECVGSNGKVEVKYDPS